MFGFDRNACCACVLLWWIAVSSAPAVAQHDHDETVKIVVEWLDSDHTSSELRVNAVNAVIEDSKYGLTWLGQQLPAAAEAPHEPRSKGLHELCTQVTLEFLRKTYKSDMVFVGQYDPLLALQPFATELLFTLLLETPQWYPLTFRVRLVPALRDLQLRPPSAARLDGLVALTSDDQEPTDLRNGLAAMMWQWGKKQYAQEIISQLIEATADGDAEDRVHATLVLADYYNVLREYKRSAQAHLATQALAKGADVSLRPVAWYSAACVHALLGDEERGMKAIQRCAELHASPDLDPSLRLERVLFEKDPEIALLRKNARFAALLDLAFGDRDKPAKGGR